MEGLSPGRIVHFFHPKLRGPRAAIIVKVWGDSGTVNLTVFTDWRNDSELAGYNSFDADGPALWATSIPHKDQVGSTDGKIYWDWPTKV